MARLRILFAASECVPFAKTGGLGDVVGALPRALALRGHDVRVVLPRYRSTLRFDAERLLQPLGVPVGFGEAWAAVWRSELAGGAPVYLLEENRMFDRGGIYGDDRGDFGDNLARYSFLARGALQLCRYLAWTPDVIHVHDWQTSLVPVYLNSVEVGTELHPTATILSIHNLGYQGWFGSGDLYQTGLGVETMLRQGMESKGSINLLKAGIEQATVVSTVSPRYASEIQTHDGGEGLDGVLRRRDGRVIGILNGIDDDVWNPATDPHLAATYDADDLTGKAVCKEALQREFGLPVRPEVPLLGIVSRLVAQKGIDVLAEALGEILALDVQLAVLGSGESWAEDLFKRLSEQTTSVRAHIGMNDPLAHRIEAGSDLFLMPSRYEPCGLNQMYSQRYGTLPVVRAVGGLDDTVHHDIDGFKFSDLDAGPLARAVAWGVYKYRHQPQRFRDMQRTAMTKPMGWRHAARQYEALYRLAKSRRIGRL